MFLDIYKRQGKPKRQSTMDNPKKLARSGTQDEGEKYKSLPSHMSIAIPHFGLPSNSCKPITDMAWVGAQLCKLQKSVHSTRSSK
jgi:hypothetical protein